MYQAHRLVEMVARGAYSDVPCRSPPARRIFVPLCNTTAREGIDQRGAFARQGGELSSIGDVRRVNGVHIRQMEHEHVGVVPVRLVGRMMLVVPVEFEPPQSL